MEDYYKILAVNPQSSSEEIAKAIDAQHTQVRRLINHHDPNVVNQANQALQILEQMKVTLLDAQKRAEYDLSINKIGGLADTTATLPQTPGQGIFPGSSPQYTVQNNIPPLPEGWICPNCSRSNPKGSVYCQFCSTTIGKVCPNCQTHYESRAEFCPSCGMTYEQAQKKSSLAVELETKKTQLMRISRKTLSSAFPDERYFRYLSIGSLGWAAFLGLRSVIFLLAVLLRIFLPANGPQSSFGVSFVMGFSLFSNFLLWMSWIAVFGLFFYLIRKKVVPMDVPSLAGYAVLSLLAIIFQGSSFNSQVYQGNNHWLIFTGVIAAVLIGLGGYLFSKYPQVISPPVIEKPFYKKVEAYVKLLFAQYDHSIWVITGVGAALTLLAVILSTNRWIGLIAGLVTLAVSVLLLIIAYRTHKTIENLNVNFENSLKLDDQEKYRLESEITQLQQQINTFG